MTLKILGGEFKGRTLYSPKTTQTRPTLAVMRQAVFNILQASIKDVDILDLYAGSGAMGLEALSRGAKSATFVETDKRAFQCIAENIQLLGVEKHCTLFSYDVLLALKKLTKEKKSFDLIYADPPYEIATKCQLLEDLLELIDGSSLLRTGGHLFLEESVPGILKPEQRELKHLRYLNSRHFSRSLLHQFEKISIA